MKKKQQQYGQYFTENNQVNDIVNIIKKHADLSGECLEPSFGDGAFIDVFKDYNLNIDAYEIDTEIFKDKFNLINVNLFNKDFIYNEITKKYNFIVGNPPYIELTYSFYDKEQQKELSKLYKASCDGRMNLTHIFIYKCLELLEEDGILAFLVPSSILTSPYYNKIRSLIHENCNILHIKNDVNFKNVAIKVSLIIIQKTKNVTEDFILKYGKNIYFSENVVGFPKQIISLKDEGFKVSIGEVVWNQHKEKLTNENDIETKTLVYSTHIGKDKLEITDIKNQEKKKYIVWENIKHTNCILMPRTISKKLKFYYLKNNNEYVFENHVLVITNKDKSKLDNLYLKLKNDDFEKYIGLYFNSSNLSAEEVLNLPYKEIFE
jgi:adenine-specific DNA-methyltransferase